VPVHPSTRQHLNDHPGQAEFALKVAMNFECLTGTPAHDSVRAALAQVGRARTWVREKLAVEPATVKPAPLAEGQELPLTRKERLGYRWS
jgi:hypothetical protein